MKNKIVLIIVIFLSVCVQAQNAVEYFPVQAGYKWYYQSVPLDTLNNPVDSLKYYVVDSFAVVSEFNGKNANIVLTKTGLLNTISTQPFLDSLYFSFDGSNGYEYFDPGYISKLVGNIDTTLAINFFTFFNSLEGWYSYYRFNSAVNQSYTVFSKDTTVTYDSTSLPIRFQLLVKRLSDETISTAIGSFECKKFLLERRLSYLVTIPPLPTFAFKILGVEETVWLAPANWMVKSYIPSTSVDFSILGIPAFTVPGLETNIITPITGLDDKNELPGDFRLFQNYPNPFNPGTKISWQTSVSGWQTLKVYDILGNEVATLVNEFKPSGYYEVSFNPVSSIKNPASGVYFYQLKTNDLIQTKKMIFLK
jgi:hypothetical protein